ncbi:N-acetylglutaminylglutamine synthetase [Caenispirillum salinarum]|uniref:N-acetylglutaminylglutamine synthetase n=1 Tax=Caenispirillum salinarum TaxID=859058 RepID=UPI0038504474
MGKKTHPPPHQQHRLQSSASPSLKNWGELPRDPAARAMEKNVVVECGWGRLIFAQTFDDPRDAAELLRDERPGRRDIVFYIRDPHVALAHAPQELFLDPSHTFRLWLNRYRPSRQRRQGFTVRRVRTPEECDRVNRIYSGRGMVPFPDDFLWANRNSRILTVLVAVDDHTGDAVGVVTGVDHKRAFNDPDNGSSLWALAVDGQTHLPGIGEALVRQLAEHYQARGRAFMDLSVMHTNEMAIRLYEKLGFERVPVFTLKHKNSINERLFIGPEPEADLNPYARIIVDEARRRGIAVEVLDEEAGYFALSHGGRSIICRESLTELTTAIAMSRCDDKVVTRRLLEKAGLRVPRQKAAGSAEENAAFLERCKRLVVKPARGEQGQGISVDLSDAAAVERAVEEARRHCETVLLEEFCAGQDLRIIVIDSKVVAAATRRPAAITGNGRDTVRTLIEHQSRRRAAATGGESRIPTDAETQRCLADAGLDWESVPPDGREIVVRKTANLHTGGTIHDVTERLHHTLVEAAVRGARALDIPVVGFDFLVPDVAGPDYVIIEANERPGLANHEPQPTAERFIDLLFPQTRFAPLADRSNQIKGE